MRVRNDVIAGRFEYGVRLTGMSGPATERPWLGQTIGLRQDWAFVEAGIPFHGEEELPETKGRFLVRADIAITHQAVKAFAEAVGEIDCQWAPTGRIGGFIEQVAFGDDGPWLVYLAPGGAVTEERLNNALKIEVDPKENTITVPLSEVHLGASAIELPFADRLVMPTGHWLQLLWANLLGLGPFLWRSLMGRNVVEVVFKGSWAVLKAGSFKPERIGAQLGRKGKNCRIHPTAVVEGCWLGDDIEIGAGAIVRGSVLADGATVEDLALVEFSLLSPTARVQRQAMVKFCVLGRGSAAGGLMQLGLLDKDAALKRTGVLMDISFGQGVQVLSDGELWSAPMSMAGVCVGEGTTVGAGVQVAAGRCLPPGLKIIPGGASTVSRVPDGLSGLVVVADGSLEPR
jgi:hypothetical protein